jgi:putative membrane protein
MVAWTLVFHLTGLVFWIGSLLAVTHVLAMHSGEKSPEARAALGRLESKLLKGLAHPGAALMVISGVLLLAEDPYCLRATWLHLKIPLVLVMVALDLRVYFRAKAFQAGQIEMTRGECMALHGIIAVVFMAILVLVLIKPFS